MDNYYQITPPKSEQKMNRKNYDKMIKAIKDAFSDHAIYTKFFINSFLSGSPDSDIIAERLLRNQVDTGKALEPFVGKKIGDQLANLLKEHILLAVDVLKALKMSQSTHDPNLLRAICQLFDNGRRVARFLSSLNPVKLPYNVVLEMFNRHNKYVIEMAVKHYSGQYDDEYKIFDAYYDHMMMFYDTILNGILK